MQRAKPEVPDRVLPSKEEPLYTVSKIKGIPNIVYRMCRTPDCKRVVGGWMLYEDVNATFDEAKGWKIPTNPEPLPYDVRPIPGKGRGMIATRKIVCGEIIVQDRPVLMAPEAIHSFPSDPPNRHKHILGRGLLQLLYWLEPEDRSLLLSLHNCKTLDDWGPIAGILFTNAVGFYYYQSQACQQYKALSLKISMANHSCSPNALYHMMLEEPFLQFRAIRDIAPGEEITTSYLPLFSSRAERRGRLMSDYGFECTCLSCSKPVSGVEASDARRKFISDSLDNLGSRWRVWLDGTGEKAGDKKQLIEHLRAVVEAMDTEKLGSHRCGVIMKLASAYAALDDEKNFKKWAAEVVRTLPWIRSQIQVRAEWQAWLRQPRSMPLWGKRCSAK